MEKMKMHTTDFVDQNIEKIAELFPHCVTEVKEPRIDTNTHELNKTISENSCELVVRKAIDFDLLRQELSTAIVEGSQERYRLDWPGKREALLTANAPIAKTLRPCRDESVDFDTTENLFIEGDNLDALKLLQETYLGKVKMIYIDPPYNTGKDFIYADNFAESTEEYLLESGQKDKDGNRLIANTEANGRFHSDWLSMMYSRLKLARNLLKDDGVIFISIDDNEVHNLRKICDEIFGAENFVAELIWKSRQIIDSRNQNNVSSDHEYIILYSKSSNNFKLRGKNIDIAKYNNPDNDTRGPWMSNSILGLADASQRPNLHYDLIDPSTNIIYPCSPESGWRYSKETMAKKLAEKRIVFPKKPEGRPREKKFLLELSQRYTGFSSMLTNDLGYTLHGTRELRNIFKGKYFDFPKPSSLLKALIQQGSCVSNDIILDFFAGSSTTAHAVMQLNAEDGGKRKFIMVQLPEACDEKSEAFKAGYTTIAEISKERIRRAGAKIQANHELTRMDTNKKQDEKEPLFSANNSCELVSISGSKKLDVGFRVLKVDSSNMADVYYAPDKISQDDLFASTDNIKKDRSSEDLLFQVLLDWGVDLTLPIRKETIADREVFFVDNNALVACFAKDGQITEDFCKQLAEHQPLRVVFRDSGFKDDSPKINVEQIFKLLSPHTEVKTI